MLDIIAAYESGLADTLREESEKAGRPLSVKEAEEPWGVAAFASHGNTSATDTRVYTM